MTCPLPRSRNSRDGGGPGLAGARLHDDLCTDELRGQRGGLAEEDGPPSPRCPGGEAASRGWDRRFL